MYSSSVEIRLQESIAAYLQELEAARTPDRAAWLARAPEFADGLRSFFADHDKMIQAAAPVRAVLAPRSPCPPRASRRYSAITNCYRSSAAAAFIDSFIDRRFGWTTAIVVATT